MQPSLIVLATAALGLSACAPVEGGPQARADATRGAPRTCFLPQQVVNFRQAADRFLYLRTSRGDVFEVGASGCLDLGSSYGLAITPTMGVSDRLCVGDSARVLPSGSTTIQGPCLARISRSLTPAEIDALAPRDRP